MNGWTCWMVTAPVLESKTGPNSNPCPACIGMTVIGQRSIGGDRLQAQGVGKFVIQGQRMTIDLVMLRRISCRNSGSYRGGRSKRSVARPRILGDARRTRHRPVTHKSAVRLPAGRASCIVDAIVEAECLGHVTMQVEIEGVGIERAAAIVFPNQRVADIAVHLDDARRR